MATKARKGTRTTAFLPKPVKIPGLPPLPTPASFRSNLPPIVEGREGSVVKLAPVQVQVVPPDLQMKYPRMTLPEARIYIAFLKRGKREGQHFLYQVPQLGGLAVPGGTAVDFAYIDTWPWLLLPVNGNYWHYQRGYKIVEHDLQILRRLRELGYGVIVLDENDIEERTAVEVLHLAVDLGQDISELRGKY